MMHETTEWKIYTQCGDAWEAMLAACEEAEISIDFEQYIFRALHIGHRFLKLFERKAKQGVTIRLLCDAFGSLGLNLSRQKRVLERHGVELHFYNPIRPWRPFPRDHRKIAVIDGKVAFVGGVCIDERMRDWRDTHARLTGPVVQEIQYTFDGLWNLAKEGECRVRFTPYRGKTENSLYLNDPLCGEELREKLMRHLKQAEKRIMIATPYFVPAAEFTRQVCERVKSGVEVSIMTSAFSNPFSYALGRQEAGKFLENGARYLIYEKTMLHAKTILIDDDFIGIGSFNVDNLSFYRNQEADVVSHDPAIVAQLARQYEADAAHCRNFTYEQWQSRPLGERALAAAISPFRGYL